jgi:hypothetical protein
MIAAALYASLGSVSANGAARMEPEKAVDRGAIVLADAHDYRHCHNFHRRTYCHKTERLHQNWPPNTNTPHRPGEAQEERCPSGSARCGRKPRSDKG